MGSRGLSTSGCRCFGWVRANSGLACLCAVSNPELGRTSVAGPRGISQVTQGKRRRDLMVDLLKWDSHSADLVSRRASAEAPYFALPPH